MEKIIGIIGFGNMGSVIGEQLKSKYQIWAFDKDKDKTNNLLNINIADNALDLVNKVDALILAVKPQDFDAVLMQIKQYIQEKLVIFIAAGISTVYIENKLGKIRVIRVMPNLPARIGKGMICLCKGRYGRETDLGFAQDLFDHLGQTMLIEENLMNAATAISGSGPGYFFHLVKEKPKEEWEVYANKEFIPALTESAQEIGFTSGQAELLAAITTKGSVALLQDQDIGLSPAELCIQVSSKGGTTEAGLKELHSIDDLQASAIAALRRAEELSKKMD